MENADVAVRTLSDGSTEEVGWLTVDGGSTLYHVTRVPAGPVRAWLLLTPAIGGEHDGGYRRQTLLGRALSPLGVATRRIHYRGTGNSNLSTVTTRDTMIADALAAGRDLAARFETASGAVLGERLGAMVAAAVASTLDAHQLLLWQPVADIESYRRELGRAAKLQEVATGSESQFSDDYENGEGDLVGFSVPRLLMESFVGHPLVDSAPGTECNVHLFQFGRKRLDPRYEKLVGAWEQHVCSMTTHLLVESELWWFAPGPWKRGEETRPVTLEAVDATVAVLKHERLPQQAQR